MIVAELLHQLAVPDFFLIWSWFAGVIGNYFFFDQPGIALIGGVILDYFLFHLIHASLWTASYLLMSIINVNNLYLLGNRLIFNHL
jgi:hypothetical protein